MAFYVPRSVLLLALLALLVYMAQAERLSLGPCKYCKYCDFCSYCDQCPCEPSADNFCDHCKYCSYCTLCSMCDSVCDSESVVGRAVTSVGSLFGALPEGVQLPEEEVDDAVLDAKLNTHFGDKDEKVAPVHVKKHVHVEVPLKEVDEKKEDL